MANTSITLTNLRRSTGRPVLMLPVIVYPTPAVKMRPYGATAYATLGEKRIEVYVNRDNALVQDALYYGNESLLRYICVHEIATVISQAASPEAFFHSDGLRDAIDGKDANEKRLLITAFLMSDWCEETAEATARRL